MITKDWLLEQAEAAETVMEQERLPAGTLQTEVYRKARIRYDAAMNAARWLEEMNLTERAQVGPFGSKAVVKGDRVRIKAGTIIRTTHPRYDRNNPKVAKRNYTITVYDVYSGSINSHWHRHQVEQAARDQTIVWPGEGGYWCYVSTSDIEVR